MKPVTILLAFCGFIAILSAWSSNSFLQKALRIGRPLPSVIPQFILDTNHPWLAKNEAWLSRYPRVKDALCSNDSRLWTHPSRADYALPTDLFTNLRIENVKIDSRFGWTNAVDRLYEMMDCKAALDGVRHLDVDIYNHQFANVPSCREPTFPPPELPPLFADVLTKMSGLERLDWGISGKSTRDFERSFVEKNLTLPSVKHLQPGAWSDYLISRCPNLEILVAGSDYHWSWNHYEHIPGCVDDPLLELIKASTGSNLQDLRLSTGWYDWNLEMLEGKWPANRFSTVVGIS